MIFYKMNYNAAWWIWLSNLFEIKDEQVVIEENKAMFIFINNELNQNKILLYKIMKSILTSLLKTGWNK